LRAHAVDVNQVWNYDNAQQMLVWRREPRFFSGECTNGVTKAGVALHSQMLQAISETYASQRKQTGKVRLRWRVWHVPKRSVGVDPIPKSVPAAPGLSGQSIWHAWMRAKERCHCCGWRPNIRNPEQVIKANWKFNWKDASQ
jgi:hypothetical protein